MNVDRTRKLYIPLECGGRKYHITVQVENPGSNDTVYMATGSDFIDPVLSWCGFGHTVDEAVVDFLEQYRASSQSVYHRVGDQNVLIAQFDPGT